MGSSEEEVSGTVVIGKGWRMVPARQSSAGIIRASEREYRVVSGGEEAVRIRPGTSRG
jgi:hypothetical protein